MSKLAERHELKEELRAHLAARRELGPEMDDLTVASFLDKLERQLDARIDARLGQKLRLAQRERRGATVSLIITLTLAIPLAAVTVPSTGLPGLVLILLAVLALNFYRR